MTFLATINSPHACVRVSEHSFLFNTFQPLTCIYLDVIKMVHPTCTCTCRVTLFIREEMSLPLHNNLASLVRRTSQVQILSKATLLFLLELSSGVVALLYLVSMTDRSIVHIYVCFLTTINYSS